MRSWIVLLLFVLSCSKTYVKTEIGPEGKIVTLKKATLKFPEGAVVKTTTLKIAERNAKEKHFKEGLTVKKYTFTITPETLGFKKPVLITLHTSSKRANIALGFDGGYLPLAGSIIKNNTLYARINHTGSYSLVEMPEKYGILNASNAKEALLLISDLHTGNYLGAFREYLKKQGYALPVWTFTYPLENTITEDADFLHSELNKLHEKYGEFRLDVLGFGVGGLITQRYEHDAALYQKDLGSAIIAVGTPFKGSALANSDSVQKSRSPYRFYFIDGMGKNATDISPGSTLIKWIKENRFKVRGLGFWKTEENSNFASISGVLPSSSNKEKTHWDGLVTLSSTHFTPLEPEPFHLNHFQLYENQDVYKTIKGFLELYHHFNWPELFIKIWNNKADFNKISDIWEKEINLHFRNQKNFNLLVEFNENLLLSVPKNGIIITNGDNDTYPSWYLQTKRGIRKDVLIVNWSLLNIAENAIYLKKQGLPIPLTQEQIKSIRPKREKSGEIVFPADSIIKLLFENKERPLVFASTVTPFRLKNYPLQLRGLVFEPGKGEVNIKKTEELFHSTYKLENTFSVPPESLNLVCKMMVTNYGAALFKLIKTLVAEQRYEEALNEIQYAKKFPIRNQFIIPLKITEATIYYKKNNPEKANNILRETLDILKNSNIIISVSKTFFENGQKEMAIKVLAEWLKDHPGDKEVLNQLIKYGEE